MKVYFELSTIGQLDSSISLKKRCLIIIILNLTKDYKDINMDIIKLFKKAYIKYN